MENKKIDIYMAALFRQGFAVQTINTLRNQPEFGTATITCNNHDDKMWRYMVDVFQFDDRIKLYRHDNEKTSNEKLRYVGDGKNEYCGFFDNDLWYPPDYLKTLIDACDRYNAMISCHGVILAPRPIRSYYHDRQVFRSLGDVDKDYYVDIASNCGSVFKRNFFDNYENWYTFAPTIPMDDILTAKQCIDFNIKRVVVKHSKGWLKHKEQLPGENYVFDLYKDNDSVQTAYINKYF